MAAYLAVQSVEFYSTLAWLAPSYTARGWDPTHAGYLLSVFTAAQLVSGLLAPALTDQIIDRRVLLLSASVLGLLGQAGLWLAPTAAPWVWATVLGFGQGASFALGLVLMVDYAGTPAASARLAGMAFFFSYTIASFGPASMGAVRDLSGVVHGGLGHPDGADARPARVSSALLPARPQGRLTAIRLTASRPLRAGRVSRG